MKETIETRELIELDTIDGVVRGTYHKPYYGRSGAKSDMIEPSRIGVLFLNSLTPTRAATGDSAVYWADAFAECGYPSFRLDLPGFGDSDGDLPVELLNFVDTGGYASAASVQASEITKKFGLSGVVVVGLCAGAVSALYTAAASKDCKGVVLMDPYFHLPLVLVSGSSIWQKAKQKLTRRILVSVVGKLIGRAYDRVKVLFAGSSLPSNTNFPLLARWKSVVSAGLPILVLRAPQTKLKIVEFDYLSYLLEQSGLNGQIVVKDIEGTDHSFSNRVGRVAVRQYAENWLNACFPLKKRGEVAENALHSESNENTAGNHATSIACTANLCLGK